MQALVCSGKVRILLPCVQLDPLSPPKNTKLEHPLETKTTHCASLIPGHVCISRSHFSAQHTKDPFPGRASTGVDVEELVHVDLRTSQWCASYDHAGAVGAVDTDSVAPEGLPLLLPPNEHPRAGRPRKNRLPSHGEGIRRSSYVCGRCGQAGHNRRRCDALLTSSQ